MSLWRLSNGSPSSRYGFGRQLHGAASPRLYRLGWLAAGCTALIATASWAAGSAHAAGMAGIRLTVPQQHALGIQTAQPVMTQVQSAWTVYGRLKSDPDSRTVVAAPVTGVIVLPAGGHWPELGELISGGSIAAHIKPAVTGTLYTTLALELTRTESDIAAARIARSTAKLNYRRQKTLYAMNRTVSLKSVQNAHAAYADAAARLLADRKTIASIRRQIAGKGGTSIPLPVFADGTVTRIFARPGQIVAAGQPILKLQNFHTLLAEMALPADRVWQPLDKAPIDIHVTGYRRWIPGNFMATAPAANPLTGGMGLLYRISNPGGLRPGMRVKGRIPKTTGAGQAKMEVIPRSAAVWWGGKRWIYIETGRGRFEPAALIPEQFIAQGYAISPGKLPAGPIVVHGGAELLTFSLHATLKKSG